MVNTFQSFSIDIIHVKEGAELAGQSQRNLPKQIEPGDKVMKVTTKAAQAQGVNKLFNGDIVT